MNLIDAKKTFQKVKKKKRVDEEQGLATVKQVVRDSKVKNLVQVIN